MQFEVSNNKSSIIKVIGVGGGGSNAVNHMFRQGIKGVDFIVCNTDLQDLDISPVPLKIQLGASLTQGLGAGSLPEVGRNAAIESIDDIRKILGDNTKMIFITAGMGGGTGTGAAPIIASVAREMGILTVGIVTLPFSHEGKKRKDQAMEGIEQMKKNIDTLLIINNDKLREIYGNLKVREALGHADNVLTTAAKSIAEIITVTLHINVDFSDIQTVMKESGVAIMGSASASGENRAVKAIENALNSPLLNDNNIKGARYVLLNIVSGNEEITMDELGDITDYVQEAAGQTAEIIKGYGVDENLGDKVSVTIIATGFKTRDELGTENRPASRIVRRLDEDLSPAKPAPAPVEEKAPEIPAAAASATPAVPAFTEQQPQPAAEIKAEIKKEDPAAEAPVQKEEPAEEPKENPFVLAKTEDHVSIELEIKPFTRLTPSPLQNTFRTPETKTEQKEQKLEAEPVMSSSVPNKEVYPASGNFDEHLQRAKERIARLKELSMKLKSSSGITDLEKEPAYVRRNVTLESTTPSSGSDISRFTLSVDEEKKPEIRPNNPYLHDKVD